ncbi:MAG: tetratricopeptide repeat protein [Planctomycetes bacterium]|nr:tetratricopeptide repeat protein [Planctomycetota bacterium]
MERDQEHYERGLKLAGESRLDEAQRELELALAANPGHADSLEVLGVVFERRGELERAIEVTRRLIEVAPLSIMGHANLSRFFMLQGRIPEAEEMQGKARVLGWREQLTEGDASGSFRVEAVPHPSGTEPSEARVASSSGGFLAALTAGADASADEDELARKVRTYRQLVELDPEDPMSHWTLGKALHEAHDLASAEHHLREAVRLDSRYSAAYLALGRVLIEREQLAAAREILTRGVQVADEKGDLQPKAYMEKHLRQLGA